MWANVVAHYMYYLATFSVRNSRNYLTYEISTDSDRKSIVLQPSLDITFSNFIERTIELMGLSYCLYLFFYHPLI
jgi:hypothetical protein